MALTRSKQATTKVSVHNACLWKGGLDKLTENFSKMSVVEEVLFTSCVYNDNSAVDIANVIKERSVKHLRLVSTNSSIRGPEILMEHLPLDRLETLDLTGSKLTDRSIKVLTDRLKTNTSLKTLILSSNPLSEQSVMGLAEVLRVNQSLKELHLSQCHIDNRKVTLLASAISCNTRLEKLVLSSNSIGTPGLYPTIAMLQMNVALKSLSLERNPIEEEGLELLLISLKKTEYLMELFLSEKRSRYFFRVRWEVIKQTYREWMGPQFDLDDRGRFYRNANPYDGKLFVRIDGSTESTTLDPNLIKLTVLNQACSLMTPQAIRAPEAPVG